MTAGAVLRLKRGHDRPRVHPWIFKGDVAVRKDLAQVLDGDHAVYSPRRC
jgi:hypothetical protein